MQRRKKVPLIDRTSNIEVLVREKVNAGEIVKFAERVAVKKIEKVWREKMVRKKRDEEEEQWRREEER